MNTRPYTPSLPVGRALAAALALLALVCGTLQSARAQATAGGTAIVNQASASYTDGSESYTTVSNTVTVTVANVSGLAIIPDNGSNPSIVAGQTKVDFAFTVTNASNFDTKVRFLATGGSIVQTGPATVQMAVVDANGDGLIDADDNGAVDAGDVDIRGNVADVSYPAAGNVARNTSFVVIVRVTVTGAAAPGDNVRVQLGDAAGGAPSYDNQVVAPANLATAKVRTDSGASAPVNGESEARGDITATVQTDARLSLSINYPSGPVALGSNITYNYTLENTGQRAATQQTLNGAPAGSNTGVFVVVPVPLGTDFASITPPGGVTVLYSVSDLSNDPRAVGTVWTTVAPGSGVKRVAFNVGNSLAAGAVVNNLQVVVTVQTTVNASTAIYAIGDAFAQNNVLQDITDQSGDAIANKGDNNANFNEPKRGVAPDPDEAVSPTQGYQVPTTLVLSGSVLIGPSGFPTAVGPTNNNDDYTNKSVAASFVNGLGFGDNTGADADVDFVNTIRNTGNGNDTFTLSAPTVPAGFTVWVNTGSGFVNITAAGSSTTVAVAFGADANVTVRVRAPSGTAILNGFAVTVQAESANTAGATNRTINRLYTGFLRLTKTATVINNTGVGNGPGDAGPDDAVPGALIEYVIQYENISNSGDPLNPTAGTNCVQLTASSVVITENGNNAPNNWGTTTNHVVGSASDSRGAVPTGDGAVNSTLLTDPVGTLAPGETGTFTFRRQIK